MAFNLPIEQLEACEKELGLSFPEHYRNALLEENGGTVETNEDYWEIVPIKDKTDRKRLSRTCNDIIHETNSFSKFNNWHENAYVIAQNGSGDALVFFREGNRFEKEIFMWSHEDGALQFITDDLSSLRNA